MAAVRSSKNRRLGSGPDSADRYAKLAGLKNGRLLDAAEAAGFEVLITVD